MDLTQQAMAYHQQLQLSEEGKKYYVSRGISQEAIDHFLLGWISDPLSPEARGFTGCPTIPYVTTTGRVIWLKVRTNGKPKYLVLGKDYPLPEPKVHLFNAMQAIPSITRRTVYLVEGEFDAIIAWQAGLKAVAVPGATQWYEPWSHLFMAADVRIAFDGDDPGAAGAQTLMQKLSRRRVDASIVKVPQGTDITDLWLQGGKERVLEVLNAR